MTKSIVLKFLKNNLPLLLMLSLAAILRFAGYFDKLNVSIDQGRDAIIGLESLRLMKAPLLGPPSSSWGFNFGPLYYYVIIFFTAIIPGIFSPWIGFTLISILSVFLAYWIGLYARDKNFGLMLSLVTAVSYAEIANSSNLLNTALVSFAVFLSFFGIAAFYKSRKNIFLVLTGLGVALALNSHLQAAPLLLLLPSLLFLTSSKKIGLMIKNVALTISGFSLGMIPLLIFELQHGFAWTKSIWDYMTFGQYRFYVPVRWLTDITVFWPSRWGEVLWGDAGAGIFVVVPVFLIIAFFAIKRKIDKISMLVLAVFVLEIFSIRNSPGPRSSEYLIFTHFFVIYIFSLAVTIFAEVKNKILLIAACIAIFLAGVYSYRSIYSQKTHSRETMDLLGFVKQKIGQPVSFYVFSGSFENANSLYYFLARSGLISEMGEPIAICDNGKDFGQIPDPCPPNHRLYSTGRFVLYDFSPNIRPDFEQFGLEKIDPLKLYLRTYNNYEVVKY